MATKDFSEWLVCMDLSDYEDIYFLYRSIEDCDAYGSFETQIAKGSNNGWIVKATYLDEALHLASEKAKEKERNYCRLPTGLRPLPVLPGKG